MSELKLKFKNENGDTKRMQVLAEEFFIGRHSENDLSITDSAVSRKHLKIERFGDMFVASDTGSTLGTKINGQKLTAPVTLKNGDRIVLGESVEISVIFGEEVFDSSEETGIQAADEIPENEVSEIETPVESPAVPVNSNGGSSVPVSFFIIAPVLGILFLILLGGIFLLIKNSGEKEVAEGNDFIYSGNRLREKNQTEDFENRISTTILQIQIIRQTRILEIRKFLQTSRSLNRLPNRPSIKQRRTKTLANWQKLKLIPHLFCGASRRKTRGRL